MVLLPGTYWCYWLFEIKPLNEQCYHLESLSLRDGAGNLPTEGLELSTQGLKYLESAVFIRHFAKLPPTKTQNVLRRGGGLDASNDGAVAPLFSPGATRVIFLSGFLVHHNQFEICGYTRTRETSDKYVGITISPTSFRHTRVQIVPEKYKCKACRCTEIFPVSP